MLKGKKIIITGGSMGIGYALARKALEQGAQVALIARNKKRLVEAQKELQKGFPAGVILIEAADASNREALQKALKKIIGQWGTIDGLINNAGILGAYYFEETPIEHFEEVMKINYLSGVYATHIAAPFLNDGAFVAFVSSVAGLMGVFGYTAYAATKFAQIGFAESLYQEFALKNMHVCVLCPPDTDTPGLEGENRYKPFETAELSKNAKVISADVVADKFYKGLKKKKFLIIGNGESIALYKLKTLFPALFRFLILILLKLAKRKKLKGGVGKEAASNSKRN